MASGRSALALLCVCSSLCFLFLAGVNAADVVTEQTPKTDLAASSKEYYFRGNPTMVATETTTEVSESEPSIKDVESIERRELEFHIMMDYTPSANCKKNCIP